MNNDIQLPKTRIKVGKIEAARRQLEAAIVMYFNGGDSVSTHTLATAATEILTDLAEHRGSANAWSELEGVKPEHRARVRAVFRKAQNFFKHADQDPEEVMDFNPEATAFFILEGVERYRDLSCENPPILRVFSLWFRFRWPDVFIFTPEEQAKFANLRVFWSTNNRAAFFADFLPAYYKSAATINPLTSTSR
jgi:hypothetical protein